jgi:hypothetical protein
LRHPERGRDVGLAESGVALPAQIDKML